MPFSPTFAFPLSLLSQHRDFLAHLCETEGFATSVAEKAADELFKYLTVCSLYPELRFTPSVIVDNVWRVLLLFPELYSGVCSTLPKGKNIPYNPRRAKDPEGDQKMRYITARNVLSSTFPSLPLDAYFWPEERAEVSLRKRAREDEGEGGERSTKKSAWGSPPPGQEQSVSSTPDDDRVTFKVIGFGHTYKIKEDDYVFKTQERLCIFQTTRC